MDILEKALDFATKAHEGMKEKSGLDYINHPIWVKNHLNSETEKVAALLHDVVEDSFISLDEIEKNFGKEMKDIIDSLTKRDGEDYLEYIERCMKNPVAKNVKIIDIRHNMDLSRLDREPTDEDLFRIQNKYKPAYRLLTGHNLYISEQLDTLLDDYSLRHMIWNLYSKRFKDDRIEKNMEYILNDYSTSVSDPLKSFLEGELKK